MKYWIPTLLAFCIINAASAQEWTLAQGEAKVFASYSSLSFDQSFNPDGDVFEHPTCYNVSDRSLQLSVDYGITARMTAFARVPYRMVVNGIDYPACAENAEDPLAAHLATIPRPFGGSLNALGNVQTGLNYRLSASRPFTASLLVEWNTGSFNYIDGTATGFNSAGFFPGIAYTHGTEKFWTSVYAAGELRTNGYAHAFNGRLEMGYKPFSILYVAINAAARLPVTEADDCDCTLPWSSLYLAEQAYVALTLKTGLEYKQFGMHLATGIAPYAANIGAAPVATIGFSYHLLP